MRKSGIQHHKNDNGFTVLEVIIASSIMTILAVGTLSVYSYVVKLNQGNALRSQALTVLQAEAEWYRSLKFVPGVGLSATELSAGTKAAKTRTSGDPLNPNNNNAIQFTLTATITNYDKNGAVQNPIDEATCTFKEIRITAVPVNPRQGWLSNLKTDLTIQRVRSN